MNDRKDNVLMDNEQQPTADEGLLRETATGAPSDATAPDANGSGAPAELASASSGFPADPDPVERPAETPSADAETETEAEEETVDRGEDAGPLEETPEEIERPEDLEKQWFILKVQSNRENSICDALRRQIAIRGLDDYFGEILIPTEDVAEFKNGKRRVVKRKLYPGYIVVRMALTDETWFVVRETPGIGDFTGAAGKPSPMLPEEIEPILRTMYPPEEGTETVKTAIPFKLGDRVRIKDGTFENFEGDVETIDEANGRVTVIINIFGRSTPVELEHWQIESV